MSNIKIIEETLSQCSFFKDEMILQINEAFENIFNNGRFIRRSVSWRV